MLEGINWWYSKSCTSWDGSNTVIHAIFILPTGWHDFVNQQHLHFPRCTVYRKWHIAGAKLGIVESKAQSPMHTNHRETFIRPFFEASLRFIHHHCPLWHTMLKCNTPMKTNITHLLQTNWWLEVNDDDSFPLQTWSLLLRGTFIKLWWKYFFKAGGTSNPKAFSNMALLVAPSAGLPNNKNQHPKLVLRSNNS